MWAPLPAGGMQKRRREGLERGSCPGAGRIQCVEAIEMALLAEGGGFYGFRYMAQLIKHIIN